MDVPLIVFVELSVKNHADVMSTPGANQSTQEPKSEKLAFASLLSVAPTVIASATPDGDPVHASSLSLPAAMPYKTPSAIELRTAVSSAADLPPPRLMLATAGRPAAWLPVTQSTPAITVEFSPTPAQSRTRTATSVTPLATPYVAPPIVPETCVPCPLQSSELSPASTPSKPWIARPPNSLCVFRMPVSMT